MNHYNNKNTWERKSYTKETAYKIGGGENWGCNIYFINRIKASLCVGGGGRLHVCPARISFREGKHYRKWMMLFKVSTSLSNKSMLLFPQAAQRVCRGRLGRFKCLIPVHPCILRLKVKHHYCCSEMWSC